MPHMRIRIAGHKDKIIPGGSDRPLLLIPPLQRGGIILG